MNHAVWRSLWLAFLAIVPAALGEGPEGDSKGAPSTESTDSDYSSMSLEELLNTVVTTASKREETVFDAPGIIEVITAQDIEGFGAQNLQEVLDRAAGVIGLGSTAAPQSFISMRGDQTNLDNHVLMLLNGRPFRLSTALGQSVGLYTSFPLQAIERVEVIRGPGSVLYGTNAYAGVINVITKTGKRLQGEAALQYGSFRTGQVNLSAGHAWKGLETFAAVKYLNSRGWRMGMADSIGVFDSTLMHQSDLGVSLGAKFKGFSLTTFFAKQERRSFRNFPLWPVSTLATDRLLFDVGYARDLGSHWSVNANITHNYRGTTFAQPGPPTSTGNTLQALVRSNDVLGELTLNGRLFEGMRLMVGGVAEYQTGETIPPSVLPPYDWMWWSGYAQLEYRPTQFLKLVAGGQLNKPNRVDAAFVPRFATILNFTQEVGLKLLYGEAFRSASAFETAVDIPGTLRGNPVLKPERVATTDLQLFYTAKKLQGAATVFRSRQTDLIGLIFDPAGGRLTYLNISRQDFQGLELETKIRPVTPVQLTGAYTYQFNRLDGRVPNATLVPSHSAKVGAMYSNGGVTVGLFNTYYSKGQDTSVLNPARLEVNQPARAVSLLSANASVDLVQVYRWKVPYGVVLDVYGTNLLNTPMYYPTYVTLTTNSFPARPGMAWYGQVRFVY